MLRQFYIISSDRISSISSAQLVVCTVRISSSSNFALDQIKSNLGSQEGAQCDGEESQWGLKFRKREATNNVFRTNVLLTDDLSVRRINYFGPLAPCGIFTQILFKLLLMPKCAKHGKDGVYSRSYPLKRSHHMFDTDLKIKGLWIATSYQPVFLL